LCSHTAAFSKCRTLCQPLLLTVAQPLDKQLLGASPVLRAGTAMPHPECDGKAGVAVKTIRMDGTLDVLFDMADAMEVRCNCHFCNCHFCNCHCCNCNEIRAANCSMVSCRIAATCVPLLFEVRWLGCSRCISAAVRAQALCSASAVETDN
jgi:hypothetical protein